MAMDCAIRETKRERERERAHNMRGHGESLSEPHNWTCRYGEHVISDPEFNAIQRMQIQACELGHSHLTFRDLFPFINLNLAPEESLPRSQTRISIFIYCRDVQYWLPFLISYRSTCDSIFRPRKKNLEKYSFGFFLVGFRALVLGQVMRELTMPALTRGQESLEGISNVQRKSQSSNATYISYW